LLIIEFRAALGATASFTLEFQFCAGTGANHESTPDEATIDRLSTSSISGDIQLGGWKPPSYRSIAADSSGRRASQLAMTGGNA
jgi:hypothetical protein